MTIQHPQPEEIRKLSPLGQVWIIASMTSFSGSVCVALLFLSVFRTHPALVFVTLFLIGVMVSFPCLMLVLLGGARAFVRHFHSRIHRQTTLLLCMIGGVTGAVLPLVALPFLGLDLTDKRVLGICGRFVLTFFCYGSCLGLFASLHEPARTIRD